MAQRLRHLLPMLETRVRSLGRGDPLEKEMAPHSSILAWRIPWTEEPGGPQSTGSLSRVRLFATPWIAACQASLYFTISRSLLKLMSRASLVAQRLKRLPAMQETWVQSLGRGDPLEKEMATHSSILAWRIPWTEEPGGLQSPGSQRVGHD